MRKTMIYFATVLLLACVSKNKEAINEIMDYEVATRQITIEDLAFQKLKNHIELLKIKNDYPEFGDSLLLSSSPSKDDFFKLMVNSDLDKISIHQIGEKEKISDSVERIRYNLSVDSKGNFLKDSIVIYIKTSEVFIDGKPEVSRNFFFEND